MSTRIAVIILNPPTTNHYPYDEVNIKIKHTEPLKNKGESLNNCLWIEESTDFAVYLFAYHLNTIKIFDKKFKIAYLISFPFVDFWIWRISVKIYDASNSWKPLLYKPTI